jgi:hypothetical protein
MSGKTMRIEQPLVIMVEAPGHKIVCQVHPSKTINRREHHGILICDLVRHVHVRSTSEKTMSGNGWIGNEALRHRRLRDRPQATEGSVDRPNAADAGICLAAAPLIPG